MDNRFQGILFTLKKRKQYPKTPDKEYYDFITFGYYDGLSVSCIDQWYQFRPVGIASLCGYVNPASPFADIYVIKGFFPDAEVEYDELFDYEFWAEFGKKRLNVNIPPKANEVLNQCPYICVSSIHLSRDFVRQCEDLDKMTNEIKSQIITVAKTIGQDLKRFHCAVFPTIGFSDYIIAFAADDFEMPTRFISRLREWKVENSNMAVISDCYTICGVYKEFEITEDNFNANSKVSLIAEFSLREGASAKEFHNILRKEIKEKLEKLNLDKELIEKVNDELKDYYITFGSIDTLIVPKVNIESYLSLFMSEAFQPGSLFYTQFISGTKTSICVSEGTDTECSDDCHLSANCDNLNKDEGHEEWNQFSTDFEKKLKEKNYAVRMLRAIEQIIQNYYNIANTLHGFDIKRSLDAFISVTLDNIRICWKDEETDWNEINSVVREFRYRVGDFVADLLRSDKPFIEGNTLSHPAIGSATKILFAYTAILNKLALQLRDDDQTIVFLVISGGADATTAIDLFAFLREDKKPVIIVVPEKGLYDIKGTLFRMLHEFMHYCGERLRKERYRVYLDIMSEIMAHDITEIFFGESFVEEYLSSEKIYLSVEKYNNILNTVKECVKTQCKQIKEEIKKGICEYRDFTDYYRSCEEEKDYYESVLFRPYSPHDGSEGVLSEEHIADVWNRQEKSLSEELAMIISENEAKIYGIINEMLQQENVNTFAANIRTKLLIQSKQKDEDLRIKTYLDIYGSVLLDNYNVSMFKKENVWYNYDEISKLGFCSMREGRADLLAARLLDMRVEEYLLAFIYEEKEIDRAMPKTLDNVLRMGSVLKVGFQQSSDRIRTNVLPEVLKFAERMKANAGYEYEDSNREMENYLKNYMDRIEYLLTVYEEEKWRAVAKALEKYLKTVVEKLKEDDNVRQLRAIYKICDMTDGERTHKTIKYLFAQWQHLAEGENNEAERCTD